MAKTIYILHENEEWVLPLRAALDELNAPYEEWFLHEGAIDMSEAPPEGVFYNRMSASSHTRGHRFGPEYAASVLAWLEAHGRHVVNGLKAVQLEVSKVIQYAELQKKGIRVPRTIFAVGKQHILEEAKRFEGRPFITKHNRGGKGLGVQLFRSVEALKAYLESDAFEDPIDGITLLQEYIESPQSEIIRLEFVGGEFVYALRVDTSEGFELCPSDACQIGDQNCPTVRSKKHKFQVDLNFEAPQLEQYLAVLKDNDIGVAGIELIFDAEGNAYTYDINTNTNYNMAAESRAGLVAGGMKRIAQYLSSLLTAL